MTGRSRSLQIASLGLLLFGLMRVAHAQVLGGLVLPEQRRLTIRDPSQLRQARLPDVPAPPTVSAPQEDNPPVHLSLDGAIRIALENSEVVRVLAGAGATSSGRTIYDPAVTHTESDRAQGRFDPAIDLRNTFDRRETPQGVFDPAVPPQVRIDGDGVEQYNMGLGLSKTTITGGTAGLRVNANPLRSTAEDLLLNPQTRSSVDLSYTQPLLQGGGGPANRAPIELARIDTERSFYQLKDAVQQLVRGVIEGYWALVFARTDVWARRQQVRQGQEALGLAEANLKVGRGDELDLAQARTALANFEANLIASEANVLRREAALRNILGLPPADRAEIVPVTPAPTERVDVDWETVLQAAQQYRPDLVQRKLAIEADEQQLLLARNQAFPSVAATALYRWDALEGNAPDGTRLHSGPGQFTGWQLGIDVSLPLGLRESRAAMRQSELLLIRDRANLQQALHEVTHVLAESYRNLAELYEQYETFQRARAAARFTLEGQIADLRIGGGILGTRFLEVRVAIADWGNAVSSEARALTQYNSELANLLEQTGTILEEHGIRFVEERYCSVGPAGRLFLGRWYPKDRRPGENEDRYESTSEPAERAFKLEEPQLLRRRRSEDRRPAPRSPGNERPGMTQPLPEAQ